MSFSSEVKKELCAAVTHKPCCSLAEGYGMALCGNSFCHDDIHILTENIAVAGRYARRLGRAGGVHLEITPPQKRRGYIFAGLRGADIGPTAEAILAAYGQDDRRPHLNTALLKNECCVSAFLRGAFLTGGVAVDPERGYHLEFALPSAVIADELVALLAGMDLSVGRIKRGGLTVLYLKESTNIEDLLILMGAPVSALTLMNVKIYKDLRNNSNRITNCDTANISKTVVAAAAQLAAIEQLERAGRLPLLSEDLLLAARLRQENPELSLGELALLGGVSRSWIARRLAALVSLAGEEKA